MTTNRTADTGRVTIATAKRLILESSPRELFMSVYGRDDGTLKAVLDAEPKSIFAAHIHEDFPANCAHLGIVPRWKYRPGKTGYAGDPATDELYTISRDELAQLADLHGLTLEGAAPVPEVAGRQSLSEPIAGAASDWKQFARDEARRIRKDRKGLGWTPNLMILGEEVAALFLARGINGPNGHALTGAYIKRWALQGHGITNDTDRLRSTLNARGK